MLLSSAAASALLQTLTRGEDERIPSRYVLGPRIDKIADPKEDAEAAVALLDEVTTAGRRRNRFLQRRTERGWGRDNAGAVTYNKRVCCGALLVLIHKHVGELAIPSDYTCECGTTYRVSLTVTPEGIRGA